MYVFVCLFERAREGNMCRYIASSFGIKRCITLNTHTLSLSLTHTTYTHTHAHTHTHIYIYIYIYISVISSQRLKTLGMDYLRIEYIRNSI